MLWACQHLSSSEDIEVQQADWSIDWYRRLPTILSSLQIQYSCQLNYCGFKTQDKVRVIGGHQVQFSNDVHGEYWFVDEIIHNRHALVCIIVKYKHLNGMGHVKQCTYQTDEKNLWIRFEIMNLKLFHNKLCRYLWGLDPGFNEYTIDNIKLVCNWPPGIVWQMCQQPSAGAGWDAPLHSSQECFPWQCRREQRQLRVSSLQERY